MSSPPGKFRQTLRGLWRFVRWPVSLLGIALFALFAVNAFDDSLKDETRAMMRAPQNHLAAANNLYVLMAGIDAPPGQAPLKVGQSNLDQYERSVRAMQSMLDFSSDIGRTPVQQRLEVIEEIKGWAPGSESIWDKTKSNTVEVARSVLRNAELMARYESLHRTTGYHNTASISYNMPFYAPSNQLRTLYLANIALRVQSGEPVQQDLALQSLAADLDMYQRMLLGDGILIDKMLATAYLHSDLLLLADVVSDANAPLELLAKHAERWISPQSTALWKIGKVFESEFRFQAATLNAMGKEPSRFPKDTERPTRLEALTSRIAFWFYLPNASLNLQSARMRRLSDIADNHLVELIDDNAAAIPWYTWGRNPIGKFFATLTTPTYREYPLRAYDVAALQRAVVLVYKIRTSRISDEAIPALVSGQRDWAVHPVSGAALIWDSKAREIRVPQLGTTPRDRRYSVRVH